MLNKELLQEHVESWTDEDIFARSKNIAAALCAVWPGPSEGARIAEGTSQRLTTRPGVTDELDDDLLGRVRSVVKPGDEIATISINRPNKIVSIDRSGLEVETRRSDSRGSGPQKVPAWMIVTAWNQLRHSGELSQKELLNSLNVKRSAFVCALLAQFPDVVVRSTQPAVLHYVAPLTVDRTRRGDGTSNVSGD